MCIRDRSKQETPATITTLFDLVEAKKIHEQVPGNIQVNFPAVVEALNECGKMKCRFFGFVIVPGENPSSFTGFAKGIDNVSLLIHDLCQYSQQFGKTSQWIVVSDKKTKKQLIPVINRESSKTKEEGDGK